MRNAAIEIYGTGRHRFPMVITCEHASARIPRPLRTIAADREYLRSHWALDIGAATVAREIVRRTGSIGVLARFSRLVCDANRPINDPTWVREQIEGHSLSFNQRLDHAERARRRRLYWGPYHDVVDRILADRLAVSGDLLLIAVHSFTPVLGGQTRDMEIGILFDQHQAIAMRLLAQCRGAGFKSELNQPYSGLSEMIFAVQRHGRMHGVVYLEIEIRQDLIATAPKARVVGHQLADALGHLMVRTQHRTANNIQQGVSS